MFQHNFIFINDTLNVLYYDYYYGNYGWENRMNHKMKPIRPIIVSPGIIIDLCLLDIKTQVINYIE